MELNDDDFNRALAAYLVWGPAMAVPVERRIAGAVPGLSAGDVAELVRRFHAISVGASAVVSAALRAKSPEPPMRAEVATLDARLSPENAGTLYFQARYGAWRDGEG